MFTFYHQQWMKPMIFYYNFMLGQPNPDTTISNSIIAIPTCYYEEKFGQLPKIIIKCATPHTEKRSAIFSCYVAPLYNLKCIYFDDDDKIQQVYARDHYQNYEIINPQSDI